MGDYTRCYQEGPCFAKEFRSTGLHRCKLLDKPIKEDFICRFQKVRAEDPLDLSAQNPKCYQKGPCFAKEYTRTGTARCSILSKSIEPWQVCRFKKLKKDEIKSIKALA